MTGPNRLPPPHGLLIDRSKGFTFTFEGREVAAFRGDTVASALAAAGIAVWSRGFKYHRPRGGFSLAGFDTNALVQLPGAPNQPADRLPAAPGLKVRGQNYSGSLDHDLDSWVGWIGRFLPVGFYYKAFFKPRGVWPFWERRIRKRAGLGRVDPAHRSVYRDKKYLHADVAVVGGGPAGMRAALAAAGSGRRVALIDENPRLGGSWLHTGRVAEADALAAEVAAQPLIEVLTEAACTGWFADHFLSILCGSRLFKLRAGRTVIATGAIEQPAIFRNNDLPGVMLASAARRLIHLHGVRPGSRAVILTANAHGYEAARDLRAAGVEVAAIVDLRDRPEPTEEGVRVLSGHTVREALPAPAKHGIRGVTVGPVDGAEITETIPCDLLCMAVGYAPAASLACHAGAKLVFDDETAGFSLVGLPDGMSVTGAANGVFSDGEGAEPEWSAVNHPYPYFPHPKGKDFVDLDEDLQVADLLNAAAEGYDHVELLKRYTTVGMGPSQGKLSSVAAVRILARATGCKAAEIGTTTARPPVIPESMAALAGRGFEPARQTAMHGRHLEAGARMMVAGLWHRPAYYGPPSDRDAAIAREAGAIRQGVGLIDVSTLGKIELRGPDAALFLGRIYATPHAKQAVGRSRYAIMLDQTGAVVDDGVAVRLAEDHFYLTATTGGVDAVYRRMLWWNAQWRLDVDVANVTAAWAAVNVAGPSSRKALAELAEDIDLSAEAFPYLAAREGHVAGVPCRLFRVGFVGELGYEIHAPAGCGEALWDALIAAGRGENPRPVGIEAQRLLRLEKGHLIVGQDTDGLTIPREVGLDGMMGRRKPFFVGGRALDIHAKKPLARALVGFALPPDSALPEECHLVVREDRIVGRVTSIGRSAALGHPIGLAYVAPDHATPGGRFHIRIAGGRIVEATVVPTPFFDPANERQAL